MTYVHLAIDHTDRHSITFPKYHRDNSVHASYYSGLETLKNLRSINVDDISYFIWNSRFSWSEAIFLNCRFETEIRLSHHRSITKANRNCVQKSLSPRLTRHFGAINRRLMPSRWWESTTFTEIWYENMLYRVEDNRQIFAINKVMTRSFQRHFRGEKGKNSVGSARKARNRSRV